MTLLSRSSGSLPERHNKGVIQASLSVCHVLNINLTAKFSLTEKAYMGVYIYIYVCVIRSPISSSEVWPSTAGLPCLHGLSSDRCAAGEHPSLWCRWAQIVLRLTRWYFCKRLRVLHIYVSLYLFGNFFNSSARFSLISVTLAGSVECLWSELEQIRSERHRTSWGSQ